MATNMQTGQSCGVPLPEGVDPTDLYQALASHFESDDVGFTSLFSLQAKQADAERESRLVGQGGEGVVVISWPLWVGQV